MDNKFKNLFSNTAIFAIGNVLTRLVLFFLMPLYTTAMTAEQFGEGELIYTTVELVLPAITLCLYEAVFRFSIDKDVDYKALFSTTSWMTLKMLIAITLLGFVVDLVIDYNYIWHFIAILVTWAIKNQLAFFARGINKIKEFALSGIINALAMVAFNVVFLTVLDWGADGYLLSLTLANMVSNIYLMIVIKAYKYFSIRKSDKKLLRVLLVFAAPLIPNMLCWWFVNISSRYFIVAFSGVAVAGLFTAATKIPAVLNVVSSIFQQGWQYSASKELNSDGSSEFFSEVFKIYSVFVVTITSAITAVTPLIALVMLQGEFYEAWIYVPILLYSGLLNCYATFFGSFYIAAKKSKMVLISTIIGAVVSIALCFVLVPTLGVHGATIASVIAYLTIIVVRYIDTKKFIKLKVDWFITIFSMLALLAQVILATVLPDLIYITSSIIFVVVTSANIIYYRETLKSGITKGLQLIKSKGK